MADDKHPLQEETDATTEPKRVAKNQVGRLSEAPRVEDPESAVEGDRLIRRKGVSFGWFLWRNR